MLIIWVICLSSQLSLSQQISKNNYTGNWNSPTSWSPTWATPQTSISGTNITINGYITLNGSVTFSGSSGNLIINDTLVISGNLILNNNNDVIINNTGILIVRGNITINEQTNITSNGYLIVTGDVNKSGSSHHGSFTSNDNPVKVFIGGTSNIGSSESSYPIVNCPAQLKIEYPNSHCTYGNMADILTDPVNSFFQSTCIVPQPTVTASGPITFCSGGSVTLTSSPGTTYLWSTGATTASISISVSGTYTVKTTNVAGCLSPASAAVIVTVNTLPAIPVITAGGPTVFCTGGSVSLTSSAGTSYLWSTGATTASINVSVSGSYTVRITNAAGCLSLASAAVIVTVNTLPALPVITAGGPIVFCTGGSVTLTSSPGTSYLWSTGATTSSINISVSGSYTVRITNAAGCLSLASATVIVTVNTLPALPVITAGGPTVFCTGGSVSLTSGPGTSYLWSTGATSKSINVTASGSYTVRITNPSGCQSALSLPATVTVNTLPKAMAGNNSPVCAGKALTLTGGPSSMENYSWTGPNGFVSSLQNPTIAGAVIQAAGIYSLVVTNASGCISTATTAVVVNALPSAIAGPDQELSIVSETSMKAELSVGETAEWSVVTGSARIINSNSPTTLVTDLKFGDNKFQWKVNNGYCEASSTVKITIIELFIPSVITPDGDGKNDYFLLSENIGRVELMIFNKWGIEEYRNSNYKNDWDGRNRKGSELPFDTYFYVMKFENGIIKKGTVLIKR